MMDIFNQYIEEKTEGQIKITAKIYRNFYNRLFSYISNNRELDKYQKNDFLKLLQKFNIKTVSNFTVVKSSIRDWIAWMSQKGLMTEEQVNVFSNIQFSDLEFSSIYDLYYFKNFDELYTVLEQVVELHLQGNEDDGEFDTLRCAIYLSWYGFEVEELVEILKEDVNFIDSTIYKKKNDTFVKIGYKAMSYIHEYAKANSYRSRKFGRSTGVEMRYKESEYLFRSCKSAK